MKQKQINSSQVSAAKNMITQGTFLVVASFLVRLVNVFYRIPVTNLWGDAGLGTYGDAYQVYGFFLVFSFTSVPSTISKLLSERYGAGRYDDARKVMRCATILVGGIGVISMLVMMLFGNVIAVSMFNNPEVARPIRFLGPTVLVVSLMALLRGYFQGMNNMKPTAVSEVIEGFLHAIFSVILTYVLFNAAGLNWSVTGGIMGTFLGAMGGMIFLIICFIRYRSRKEDKEHPKQLQPIESTFHVYKEILRMMIPLIISASVLSIKGIIDASMFAKMMDAKGIAPAVATAMRGIYTGKFVVLINLPIAIGDSFGAAVIPSIAQSYGAKDQKGLDAKFHTAIKTTMIIAIPFTIGMMVMGKPVMRLMFPSSYLGGELFWVGATSVVFYCVNCVAGGILQGVNKPHLPLIHAVIGVGVTCILNWVCVMWLNMGVYALAMNSAVFSFILTALNMAAAVKYSGARADLWKICKGPIFCSILMGISCIILYTAAFAMTGSNAISAIIGVAGGIFLYFFFMVNFKGMDEEEMNDLPGGRYLRFLRF